ncbi:MAG: DNRLRE domain-containing protein, partial [Vicinamibacterales bacterium]
MRQRGFVMLTVVVGIVLIAAITMMLATENAMQADLTIRATEALEADYVAQAALQHALWQNHNNACGGDVNVPSTPLGAHTYTASVDSVFSTTIYTVNPDRDSWLKEQAPDDNYGSEIELRIKNKAGDSQRAVYHFDLASIPVGSTVQSATAWFYVTAGDADDVVEIHALTATWAEAAVTWNNLGTSFDPAVMGSIPSQTSSGVWVPIGVTGFAQQWVNDAAANYGIMLIAASDDVESKYSSREYSSGFRPYLDVTASFGAVSPVQITATGTLASGVSRTLTRLDAPAYQTPASMVFQPGSALDDAYTWGGGHRAKNFGAATI